MTRAHFVPSGRHLVALVGFLGIVAASALFVVVPSPSVGAQDAQLTAVQLWGRGPLNDLTPPPEKIWKFRQSVAGNDLGSATAASPTLDDSGWAEVPLRWETFPGPLIASHFRKDFDLADFGIARSQVAAIEIELQYDDTAVLYLNGTEVYRSMRGNLDPDYATYPPGADIPHDVIIEFGGREDFYADIPNSNGTNRCEDPDPNCEIGPYDGPNPPAIDPGLLVDGTNTWAITVWNRNEVDSNDASVDHAFSVLVDETSPTVVINEVMAKNDTAYPVELDGDPTPEYPDWFELFNTDPTNAVDIGGWTVEDSDAVPWTFPPNTIVGPREYLVVAASGTSDTSTVPMQTDFKLSTTDEQLKLVTDTSRIADVVSWTDQFADNSMGRPFDSGTDDLYLASPTPELTNSGPLGEYPPILRFFKDRWFNQGETFGVDMDAFDPDGDVLTFGMDPLPPGVSIDGATGQITGTVGWTGVRNATASVSDSDGQVTTQTDPVSWVSLPAVPGPHPLVLSEYNAVPKDGELLGGSVLGNGGDWFELLVIEDELDVRGWTVVMRQRDDETGDVRRQTGAVFGQHDELRSLPAGTIITIGEQGADDVRFNAQDDWHIHLQISNEGSGTYFEEPSAGDTFNSTRRDQLVLIRDETGALVTPLSGETDAWDFVNGGVNASEVMNLCIDPTPTTVLSPVTDYADNAFFSTFGQPNECATLDPATGVVITDPQDLSLLRGSASLGAGSGDVTCDFVVDLLDSLAIVQAYVNLVSDTGPCLLDQGGPGHEAALISGDIDGDGDADPLDALYISQCQVGLPNLFCPA